jgi:hypothetical protein
MEGPGIPAGVVDSGLVSNLDWAPTILDLAGIPIPEEMEGRSLLERLNGSPPDDWREAVYSRNYAIGASRWYAIRTSRYKLIHHDQVDEWELIDLQEDPLELSNVHDDERYAEAVGQLHAMMAGLGIPPTVVGCSGDLNLDGSISWQDFSAGKKCLGLRADGACRRGDFDGDGVVETSEVLRIGRSVGESCSF